MSCPWLMMQMRMAVLLIVLSSGFKGGHSITMNPLTPIGWIGNGILSIGRGIGKAVTGTYRAINPTPTPHPNAHIPKSGFKPQGCYFDKEGKPDLPFKGGSGRKMNKVKCNEKCPEISDKMKYFGLQRSPTEENTIDCWCGSYFGLYGQAQDKDCGNLCPGEETQTTELCGGKGFNSVYELKR